MTQQAPETIWANPDHWIEQPPRADVFRPYEYAEYTRTDLTIRRDDPKLLALVEALRWYSEPFYFGHPRTLDGGKMASTAIAAWEKNDE